MSVESARQALAISEHVHNVYPDLRFDHLLVLGLNMSYQQFYTLQEQQPPARRYQVRYPHHIIKGSHVLAHTSRGETVRYQICSLPKPDAQGRLTIQVKNTPNNIHTPVHETTLHLADYGVIPNQDGLWHQLNWLELVAIPAEWPVKRRRLVPARSVAPAPKPAGADLVASPATV